MNNIRPHHILEDQRGLTLVEMLVVFSLISLLSIIGFQTYDQFRVKSRDNLRIISLHQLANGLERYKNDHGRYPVTGGSSPNSMYYFRRENCAGVMSDGPGPNDYMSDNSYSGAAGMLGELYPEYTLINGYKDPLDDGSEGYFNCIYIVNGEEATGPNGIEPRYEPIIDGVRRDDSNVQRYFMFCNLESDFEKSKNDGGSIPYAYELYSPRPWVCLENKPGPPYAPF